MSSEVDSEKRARALERVKKCFALAKSGNVHEAEAAMRQAQKLMDKFKFEMGDVDASRAEEFRLKISEGTGNPARWIRSLAVTVGQAFGCVSFYATGAQGQSLIFIGDTGAAEMAAYAYEVLVRQLKLTRKAYLSQFTFASASRRRRAGEVYAESWVSSVAVRVQEFAGVTEEVERAIKAYVEKSYPDVKVGRMNRRKLTVGEYQAYLQGQEDGAAASLYTPMGHDQVQAIEHRATGRKTSCEC